MKQVKIEDPLDELFGIDPSSRDQQGGMVEYDQVSEQEIAEMQAPTETPEKDVEDSEIEKKIDEVYDAAMTTFQNQMAYTEVIEPRYAARNAEVAASYLNIALSAANSRAKIKIERKRTNAFIPGMGGKVTNNTIVATREEIMRMISVDAETKPIK